MSILKTKYFLLILNLLFLSTGIAKSANYDFSQFASQRFKMTQQSIEVGKDYFTQASDFFMAKGDTANYLRCQVNLGQIAKREGQYNAGFDLMFDALPLAVEIADKEPEVEIHHLIGVLYGIYDQDSIGLEHTLMAHQIIVEQTKDDKTLSWRLMSSYLDVAIRFIEMEEYADALTYLDSCYLINSTSERLYYIDAYYANVYTQLGDYSKAAYYLEGLGSYFSQNKSGFLSTIYYFEAELKFKQKLYSKAISYYRLSLNAISDLETDLELKAKVLEHLATAYSLTGQGSKAYAALQESKEISDRLFNTQSQQNQALFEIKNKYRENLIIKTEELEAQNKLLKISQKATNRMKWLIIIIVFTTLISYLAFRYRYKVQHLYKEQELEHQKSAEMLDFKNKELTANALQMVEKEQDIKELLEALKSSAPEKHKALSRKLKHSNKKIWSDFNLRFTQTNDAFYKKLQEHYPELTPTDLKHCALVRLNFDSKEMSDLLGISINSVHMARSRIRKKMGLERSESLVTVLSRY